MKTLIVIFTTCVMSSLAGQIQDKAARIDSVFSSLHQQDQFSGNVLIAENGKAILQKSYGKAFREQNRDLNNESLFELASVSKQFTAMGIMVLKKQGKLKYEDSLRKFFPELPYYGITVRQLLNHTSGLPDYMELATKHWDSTKIMTNDSMIRLLAEKKPEIHFRPGEQWEYSNTGYALLGSIIEKASGQHFAQFMAKNVYQPAGMKRTQVYHKRLEQRTIDNYAYGYVKDAKRGYVMADSSAVEKTTVYSLDGIFGDGITNSSTTDLLKWDQALYKEKLVPKEMMAEAFTPGRLNNGKQTEYGFGWLLKQTEPFGEIQYHSGGWPGYVTYIERHPRQNKTIIILANAGTANGKIATVRNILYDLKVKPRIKITPQEKILQQYVGSYQFSKNNILKITVEEGKLMGQVNDHTPHELHAEAEDLFFRADRDFSIRFVKDTAGKVTKLQIIQEGPTVEAEKM